MLRATGFSEGIAPAGPIHAEPVEPGDSGLAFEFDSAEWPPTVGLRSVLNDPKNMQLGHRMFPPRCRVHDTAERDRKLFRT